MGAWSLARFTRRNKSAPKPVGVSIAATVGSTKPHWLVTTVKDSMKTNLLATSLLLALGVTGAWAQTAVDTVQRDVNQQKRIEQGLKSGSLNTKEAGRLEREESRVERLQARDLKDGKLTPQESAQLDRAQDKVSRDIHAAKSNDITGNPQSASSQRMQADVQRNINQQQRIEQGVQSGNLTHREAAHLERGQARVDRTEARAARDGHVGEHEQARIQNRENHQSEKIHAEKHNGRFRKG